MTKDKQWQLAYSVCIQNNLSIRNSVQLQGYLKSLPSDFRATMFTVAHIASIPISPATEHVAEARPHPAALRIHATDPSSHDFSLSPRLNAQNIWQIPKNHKVDRLSFIHNDMHQVMIHVQQDSWMPARTCFKQNTEVDSFG